MTRFQLKYDQWLQANIEAESNPRRKELLCKGLGHGTVEFLRYVWLPAVGNLDHLFPEWEVRDFGSGYRYLDLAYMPGGAKGGMARMPETLMSGGSKIYAEGTACYRSMVGHFFQSLIHR